MAPDKKIAMDRSINYVLGKVTILLQSGILGILQINIACSKTPPLPQLSYRSLDSVKIQTSSQMKAKFGKLIHSVYLLVIVAILWRCVTKQH